MCKYYKYIEVITSEQGHHRHAAREPATCRGANCSSKVIAIDSGYHTKIRLTRAVLAVGCHSYAHCIYELRYSSQILVVPRAHHSLSSIRH